MDFFEMVYKRRSVRRFSDKEIPEENVARILSAALSAPSSKNCRSSSFMVIEKRELTEKISEMRDSGSAFVKNAPLVILVMGDDTVTDLWVDNAAISATYLQLAAEALGMGSCWVHVNGRLREKDNPEAGNAEEYLKTFLPIPEGRHVLCVVAVGYPAEVAAQRKPAQDDGKIITVK